MAAPNEQPWSQYEKNYLLAEIIKLNNPPPSVLIGVITQLQIQFDWNNLVLPPGRTVNQCVAAYEEIRRPPAPTGFRGSFGPQTPSPLTAQISSSLKRPFSYETTGRRIEPKPASVGDTYAQSSNVEQPQKKRRGRPPKTDTRPKVEPQMASGTSAPPRAASTTQATVAPMVPQPAEIQTPVYPTAAEPQRPAPAPRAMPISSMVTPTAPASASHSSSSSGKRKRGRSTRSEPEEQAGAGEGEATSSVRQSGQYESPYAGMQRPSLDSPARTAQMRHRDEAGSEAPQLEGEEEERRRQEQQPSQYPTDSRGR